MGTGLRIIDVSTRRPTPGRLLRHAGVCRSVAVVGSYAYVAADDADGLRIIDVSIRRFHYSGWLLRHAGSARDVAWRTTLTSRISGVACGLSTCRNPATPWASFYDMPGCAWRGRDRQLRLRHQWRGGLRIISMSNPAALRRAASTTRLGIARRSGGGQLRFTSRMRTACSYRRVQSGSSGRPATTRQGLPRAAWW